MLARTETDSAGNDSVLPYVLWPPDAPVLVLHDPTTAVDSVTETAIADRLRAFRCGRSTLIVTNAPALLGVCDRVADWTAGRNHAGAL